MWPDPTRAERCELFAPDKTKHRGAEGGKNERAGLGNRNHDERGHVIQKRWREERAERIRKYRGLARKRIRGIRVSPPRKTRGQGGGVAVIIAGPDLNPAESFKGVRF